MGRSSEGFCHRVIKGMGAYRNMKYTESDKEAIEAILYYQYRIDKAMKELLQRHTVKAVRAKLKYMREKREKV
jgi:ribosomal protein L19